MITSEKEAMPAIVIQDVAKGYGSTLAVDHISLEIHPGEVFGILGPNGAGKTTLLEMIVGMRVPTSGSISVLGLHPVRDRERFTERVSIQPQSSGLFDHLTVGETLELFSSFYDCPVSASDLARDLGLEEQQRKLVKRLSGGQKHRLLVGLALVGDTDVVFLDEPSGSLDPHARRELWEIIRNRSQANKTIVITTHSMEEAQTLCDRIAIINRGRILALGTPLELIKRHLPEQLVVCELDEEPDVPTLKRLPGVSNVIVRKNGAHHAVRLRTTTPEETLRELLGTRKGIRGLGIEQGTLEDVFLLLVAGEKREKVTT